jgi:geranylgeranyl transferase type-1 subunit beta
MLFAFFIVSALDLLGLMDGEAKSKITSEEKQGWVEWVYHCQHLEGGFRGFTGTILEEGEGNGKGSEWDVANLPATFFALCVLLILGDDLTRVSRMKCLNWVKKLQRQDGSFGEVLSSGERIEGGRDLRFCCCAAGVKYILGEEGAGEGDEVGLDEEKMVGYISRCQSYEGGFSEGPYREAHSGLNYCAVGALAFLERGNGGEMRGELWERYKGRIDLEACVKWMLQRQTTYIEDEEEGDSDSNDDSPAHNPQFHPPPKIEPPDNSTTPLPPHAGFNGRTNKIADTCYSYWNVGALSVLGKAGLIDKSRLRNYLLEKVQHPIGGFGKGVGEPPDVLHSYLGLAVVGLLGANGDGVKRVEPTLCVSESVAEKVRGLAWKREVGG